jgi:flagellin
MSSIINTNIASLNAQRNLSASQSGLTTALQRLSSGLRINSAKDDAAGLAISQRMTSQINGLDQAARNANDGISLSQTAEGSLSAITDNLQRIRTLSLQAANSTNSSSDRAALNAEVQSSLAEIGRVASTSQFNGLNLLDGTFTASQFQVGANANQTINVTIGGASLSQLGAYQYNNSAAPVSGTALVSGDLTINGVNVGASTTGGANDIVNSINSVTNQTGVTASATSAIVAANTPTNKQSLLSGDLVINGTNIGAVSGSYDLVAQGNNVANAINLKTATTGVAATVNSTTGQISLASTTGKTIAITSSNGVAGASRVENATGLELSASTATATATLTITATAANSATVITSNTSLHGKTFSVGSGANLQTYTINDLNVTPGNVNGTSDGAGGHYISWDSTSGTAQADLDAAIKATVEANNTSVTVSSAGTAVTFTSQAKGILLAADTTITNTSGAPFSSNTATAGTGITEGNTFVIDGTTYTFANSATASTVGSATTGTIGMRVASQNAIASNIAAAVTTAHGLATPTSGVSAAAATNAVTFSTTLKGTAGNTQVLATGSAGAVAAAGVAATDGAYTASTTYGTISLNSSSNFSIAGANSAKAGLSTASSTLTAISTIDISSVTGANSAISLVDAAISQVNSTRAGLGAVQNRFTSAIANLQSSSENISAARSRIQDTDFAAETAALTRGQILQQAGTAMLAQANSLPNGVLALLR